MSRKIYYDPKTGWAIGASATNVSLTLSPDQEVLVTEDDALADRIIAGDSIKVRDGVLVNMTVRNATLETAKTAVNEAGTAEEQQVAYLKYLMVRDGFTPL